VVLIILYSVLAHRLFSYGLDLLYDK
jgi:hypothetical protein